MSGLLRILRAGPGLTVQDLGREGYMAFGLSRGGAADTLALHEAAALLQQQEPAAAIEMAGMGGTFEVTEPTRIALTGAPMSADVDARSVAWNSTLLLQPGERLTIGGATSGVYGYLSLAGGITTPPRLGSRAAHLTAGIGAALAAGDALPFASDPAPGTPELCLRPDDRFGGGVVRVMPGPQTGLFAEAVRSAFFSTTFTRDSQGNRQGIRLNHEGAPFGTAAAVALASDMIVAGDIQMTGDGLPYILLCECQTTGGYPRMGTVIGADLPRAAQAAPGAKLRFRAVTVEEADALRENSADLRRRLRGAVQPRIRDPRQIPDLLSYTLISGVTAGDDLERDDL